jgi:CubicO group peptidase (beta-lactamase class C family)
MRKVLLVLLVGMLLSTAAATALSPGDPAVVKPDPARRVDKLFARWDKPDSPGCALAVVKDGKVVHQRGFGMASLEHGIPITASTLFLIASLSKHFTVFLIFLLAQGGRLNLDDDVRKHIPEVPEFGKKITIRHLIHHTSGLREEFSVHALQGRRFEDAQTQEDFLGWLRDQKDLNFEPGQEYLYCNTGYSLLGLIIRRASGKSVRAYADEQIFRPLGMRDTVFRDDHGMVIRKRASSYARGVFGGFRYIAVPHEMPGATNLFTSVEDLARWDQNFYEARVGGRAVVEQMYRKGRLNSGKEIDYAGGLVLGSYRGLKTVEHSGAHGGYRTVLLRFPEQRFSVILLANLAEITPAKLARQVADIYLEGRLGPALPKEGKDDPKGKVDRKLLDRYAGAYRLAPGVILTFAREKDRLVLRAPGARHVLGQLSETGFVIRTSGVRYEFMKSAGGSIDKVKRSFAAEETEAPRVRQLELTAKELAAYAGDYYSPELRVLYHVTVRDGRLRVRYPRGEVTLPQPYEGDEFVVGGASPFSALRFTRGADGQVSGFGVYTGRIRNLRFRRAEIRLVP